VAQASRPRVLGAFPGKLWLRDVGLLLYFVVFVFVWCVFVAGVLLVFRTGLKARNKIAQGKRSDALGKQAIGTFAL
jgi:hypothetical protein